MYRFHLVGVVAFGSNIWSIIFLVLETVKSLKPYKTHCHVSLTPKRTTSDKILPKLSNYTCSSPLLIGQRHRQSPIAPHLWWTKHSLRISKANSLSNLDMRGVSPTQIFVQNLVSHPFPTDYLRVFNRIIPFSWIVLINPTIQAHTHHLDQTKDEKISIFFTMDHINQFNPNIIRILVISSPPFL